MLTGVSAAGDMWGDEDALVVPEAMIGFMLELTHVDVECDASQLSRRERIDQCLFVDDFPPRDVHENRAGLQGGKRLSPDQPGRLRCPLTADRHRIALFEERTEPLGALQTAEPDGQDGIGRHPAPRTDHPHAGTGAQLPHLLTDATGAHDAHRLVLQEQRPVGAMVEAMPLPIASCMGQPPGEMEEAGQDVLGHGAGVPIAARGGDDDLAAPEIPA